MTKGFLFFVLVFYCLATLSTIEYIYTFAGDGKECYGGDFGPATNAQLNPLWSLGIIVTWNGAIYFADSGNNVIRRVSTDGVMPEMEEQDILLTVLLL
jgi:hypothetical protein